MTEKKLTKRQYQLIERVFAHEHNGSPISEWQLGTADLRVARYLFAQGYIKRSDGSLVTTLTGLEAIGKDPDYDAYIQSQERAMNARLDAEYDGGMFRYPAADKVDEVAAQLSNMGFGDAKRALEKAMQDLPDMNNVNAMLDAMSEPLKLPETTMDDIMQHTHYQAVINDDYPRWRQREIGRFLYWEDARNATVQELNRLYPSMWEVNYEDQETTSQYRAKDQFHSAGGFCMALINPHVNEMEQLAIDIDRLTKELAAKQQRLAELKGK